MITYLATAAFTDTVSRYLETWGSRISRRLEIVTYEDLFGGAPVNGSAVIFSDLERLSGKRLEHAQTVWTELAVLRPERILLNRPDSVLRREQLLRRLHEIGVNSYDVYPLPDGLRPRRFPVFLRHRDEHWGPLTPLIFDQRTLERELARRALLGGLQQLLVVEFCDTSDANGLYRKYSAFVVGDEIIPRHVVFDRAWAQKTPQLLDEAKLAEELAFLESNPHADALRGLARLAGVDWGRFDYGVLDGRIQVWEINTNPIVMMAPSAYAAGHRPAQEWFAARIGHALETLDRGHTSAYRYAYAPPPRSTKKNPRESRSSRARKSRLMRAALTVAARAIRPIVVRRLDRELAQKVFDREVVEER